MATAPELIQIEIGPRRPAPKPEWLKARAPMGENYHNLKTLARNLELNTVCESAHCPNIGECWNHRTATFMLLGNLCTRRCGFCAVPKGRPQPIDFEEPRRVAEAVEKLGLKFAVVTSVNRDDDNVGGARVFADTITRNPPTRSRMPRGSADPRLSGIGRTAAHRDGRQARHPQPQHRDRASPVSRRSLRRALRTHVAAAAACQGNESGRFRPRPA